jgi:hypothetical protein
MQLLKREPVPSAAGMESCPAREADLLSLRNGARSVATESAGPEPGSGATRPSDAGHDR